MTGPEPEPDRSRRRRRARGPLALAGLVALGIVVALLVIALILYAARRETARRVLIGWLERQGVEAEVSFDRFELDGLSGTLRAGPADDPDLVVERIEVDYALAGPWAVGGLAVTPTRIRLVRPRITATLADGRVSFGSLDPVVRSFLDRPPRPGGPQPLIEIEDAEVRLAAPGGRIQAFGDARLQQGRLMSLSLRVPATTLVQGERRLGLDRLLLEARTVGDRLGVWASARGLDGALGPDLAGEGADVRLTADLPYPDTAAGEVRGAARLAATLEADSLRAGDSAAGSVRLALDWRGRVEGWLDRLVAEGAGRATGEAARLTAAGLNARSVRADVLADRAELETGEAGRWRVDGRAEAGASALSGRSLSGEALRLVLTDLVSGGTATGAEASARAGLQAGRLRTGSLDLNGLRADLRTAVLTGSGTEISADGAIRIQRAAYDGLGAPGSEDPAELRAIKQALRAFAVQAPEVSIRGGDAGLAIALLSPARLVPANGGSVELRPIGGQAVWAAPAGGPARGAAALSFTAGGGVPEGRLTLDRYSLTGGVFTAEVDLEAGLDYGIARGIDLATRGRLIQADGLTRFMARDCAAVSAELLDLGESDVTGLAGRLCPVPGRPLLTLSDGDWRLEAGARDLEAAAPFLGLRLADASGPVVATSRAGDLGLETTLSAGRVFDTVEPQRLRPHRITGRAGLADDRWTGAFVLADAVGNRPVAEVSLTHDGTTGAGGAVIDATGLVFTPEGGLQPSDISPLADGIAHAQTRGEVDFTGRFDWTEQGLTSGGRFATDQLDFESPAGPVTRLAGEVVFDSLTPLVTAPAQSLTVARVDAFLPLRDLRVVFDLAADALNIRSGLLSAAGGRVYIEPVAVPLDPDASFEGVLVLEDVQLGELLRGTAYEDRVVLDARVSGRLPFISTPDRVTFVDGQISAIAPGRVSIDRTLLTGVSTEGSADQPVPPSTVQDFAYQAMENLAFDQLDATINSLPEGRLGILFRIRGRHDPPQEQEIRLGLGEVLARRFLDRPLPLPSGTEIDLTLDSSFNLDELLADLADYNRARSGDARR